MDRKKKNQSSECYSELAKKNNAHHTFEKSIRAFLNAGDRACSSLSKFSHGELTVATSCDTSGRSSVLMDITNIDQSDLSIVDTVVNESIIDEASIEEIEED